MSPESKRTSDMLSDKTKARRLREKIKRELSIDMKGVTEKKGAPVDVDDTFARTPKRTRRSTRNTRTTAEDSPSVEGGTGKENIGTAEEEQDDGVADNSGADDNIYNGEEDEEDDQRRKRPNKRKRKKSKKAPTKRDSTTAKPSTSSARHKPTQNEPIKRSVPQTIYHSRCASGKSVYQSYVARGSGDGEIFIEDFCGSVGTFTTVPIYTCSKPPRAPANMTLPELHACAPDLDAVMHDAGHFQSDEGKRWMPITMDRRNRYPGDLNDAICSMIALMERGGLNRHLSFYGYVNCKTGRVSTKRTRPYVFTVECPSGKFMDLCVRIYVLLIWSLDDNYQADTWTRSSYIGAAMMAMRGIFITTFAEAKAAGRSVPTVHNLSACLDAITWMRSGAFFVSPHGNMTTPGSLPTRYSQEMSHVAEVSTLGVVDALLAGDDEVGPIGAELAKCFHVIAADGILASREEMLMIILHKMMLVCGIVGLDETGDDGNADDYAGEEDAAPTDA
jgi:hypothetical protein